MIREKTYLYNKINKIIMDNKKINKICHLYLIIIIIIKSKLWLILIKLKNRIIKFKNKIWLN